MWRSRRDAIDNRGGDGSLKETTAAAVAQQDDAAGIEALPHQPVEQTPLRQGRANDLAHIRVTSVAEDDDGRTLTVGVTDRRRQKKNLKRKKQKKHAPSHKSNVVHTAQQGETHLGGLCEKSALDRTVEAKKAGPGSSTSTSWTKKMLMGLIVAFVIVFVGCWQVLL